MAKLLRHAKQDSSGSQVALYVVRHGTTLANVHDVFRGQEDFPLDEKGKHDAHAAAAWLKTNAPTIKKVYHSPMRRAADTAKAIASALGVDCETDDDIGPLNVGTFAGEPKSDTFGAFAYYLDHPDEEIPGSDDSINSFADRICDRIDHYFDEAIDDGPVCLVVHTSDIAILDCYLRSGECGMSCRPEEKDVVAPGGIIAVTKDRKIKPVYKDVKAEEAKDNPVKVEHEEYDDAQYYGEGRLNKQKQSLLKRTARRRGDAATITVDGKQLQATYLGKGKFTTAYRVGDTVYTFTDVESGDFGKEILSLHLYGEQAGLPPTQRHSDVAIRGREYYVYSMPFIAPLTAASKQAWRDYKILAKVQVEARWALPYSKPITEYAMDVNNDILARFIAAGGSQHTAEALKELVDRATNYGSDVLTEFAPRNLGVDINGNLVLRDCMFSLRSIKRLEKQKQQRRNYLT